MQDDPWCGQPKAERTSVQDDPRCGQPKTERTGVQDDPRCGQSKTERTGVQDDPRCGSQKQKGQVCKTNQFVGSQKQKDRCNWEHSTKLGALRSKINSEGNSRKLNLIRETVRQIVKEGLGLRKYYVKMVP